MKVVLGRAALFGAILALPIGSCTALGFIARAQANLDDGWGKHPPLAV